MSGPTALPTRLILVRHGETEGNVQQVWHGALDAPLTARGELQVAATAARIAELHAEDPIDYFYVSPLPRAQSTAAVIATAIELQPVIEPDLREFDLGDWEGRGFQELRDVENLWGRWEQDPGFAPPHGESPLSFNRRARATLSRLADAHPGHSLLVVTHGGYISSVLASWLGQSAGDWRAFDPHNCAISILVGENGSWTGELVNDVSHLPAEARSDILPNY
jgi:probable phosphoglycerate mutase